MSLTPGRFGLAALALAATILLALQLSPHPMLYATNGRLIPYRSENFLSELVRTQHGGWMTLCFVLLAASALALALSLKKRGAWEWKLAALAGISLALLALFPTDLADLTTDALTCGRPTRIEPCTLVGRIHNPLSTLVFAPIGAAIGVLSLRARTQPEWRPLARFAFFCATLALFGIAGSTFYLRAIHWEGRWWTGLMQRSLVYPALLWMAAALKTGEKRR